MEITNKKNVSKTFRMRQSGLDSLDYLRSCDENLSASEYVNQALELLSKKEKMKERIRQKFNHDGKVILKLNDDSYYYLDRGTISLTWNKFSLANYTGDGIVLTLSRTICDYYLNTNDVFVVKIIKSNQIDELFDYIPIENCEIL